MLVNGDDGVEIDPDRGVGVRFGPSVFDRGRKGAGQAALLTFMFTLPRTATLLLLLTAAAVQQVRYVARAVLPAQDVVDTVSVAQRIEREGLPATLRAEPVSPLFPTLVAGVHTVLNACGAIDAHDWIRPPQIVAALALVLAVIPIFLTAERVAGLGPAVVATIFFIFLPALARLGADGLGDAMHLFLVSWAAWLIGMQRWTIAGLCIAAALLVRAEAAVVPLTVFMLAVGRLELRRPRFFVATAMCVVPFVGIGLTSPDEIATRLRGSAAPTERSPLNVDVGLSDPIWGGDGGACSDKMAIHFGRKDYSHSSRFHGLAATIREFVDEGLMAGGYVVPLLAICGIAICFRRGRTPYVEFVTLAIALQSVVLFAAAWKNGYLSTRHFAVPVLLGLPYAAIAVVAAARRLAERVSRPAPIVVNYSVTVLLGVFVVAALIATRQPLNHSNSAHRLAADWLRAEQPRGAVLDSHGYTALTSGRKTYRFEGSEWAFGDFMLTYILVERGDLEATSRRGESLRAWIGEAAQARCTFAAPHGNTVRDVLVFWPPFARHLPRELSDAR